jgi:4'-phosphopantetheinyl transferase EntD
MQPLVDTITAWIEARAPAGTAVAAGPVEGGEPFDEMEAAATIRAVKARHDEFHTGRRLARVALGRLGCAPTAIPVHENRVPIWPSGFVGTISHSRALCVAHVGRARDFLGIGVDLEPEAQLTNDVVAHICRPDEDPAEAMTPALLRFVAKEAFYKAYFPAACAFLDFHDVHVEFDSAQEAFVASIVADEKPALAGRRAFEGRIARIANHLVAALWIPA